MDKKKQLMPPKINCSRCGCSQSRIIKSEPKCPHIAAVKCANCGIHIKWLSKKDYLDLMNNSF